MTLLYDPTTKNLVESPVHSAPKYGLLVPNRLFVGGLGAEITEEDLRSFFSTYGPIKHCKILSDSNGMSKGYGFVTFVSTEDVEKLLKKEGEQVVYKDRKLNIGPAVRKQGTLNQVLGNAQTAAAMAGGQGGIIYANGVPCMVQGASTSVMPIGHNASMLPLQDGLAFPQLVSLPTGGVQMMMVHPQYLTHSGALLHAGQSTSANHQAGLPRGSLHLGGGLHLDPTTGISQILAPPGSAMGSSAATLLQGLGQQPLLLSTSAMASPNSGSGLEQYLCQFPYMIHPQGQALLHQQLQTSDVLGQSLSGVEMLQQKLQQQHKQHYALAEGLSSQLQYFELPQNLTQSPSSASTSSSLPQTQSSHQSIATSTGKGTDSTPTSGESKSAGIKRVLNIPYQTVCTPTYAGSVYGLPAVKILAGQGQQRIVTQALDPTDIQVLAKNLK